MSLLLNLPYEIVLLIFRHMPTARDALTLASTCSFLHKLFQERGNKLRILQSILGVPGGQSFDLEAANSLIVRGKPREWYIRTKYSYALQLTLNYDHLSSDEFAYETLHDFQYIREQQSTNRDLRAAMKEFLVQFREDELNIRRVVRFEPDEFEAAVELQLTMLNENSAPLRDDLASEHTAIALALSIFAILDEINEVEYWAEGRKLSGVQDEGDYALLTTGYPCDCHGRVAKIEARAISAEDIPGPSTTHDNFQTMTHNLFQVIRRMVARASQEDCVILPHVLCILRNSGPLFVKNGDLGLEPARDFNDMINSALDNLCQQYFISSNGGQPLTDYLKATGSEMAGDTDNSSNENASLRALGSLHDRWRSENRTCTCPFRPGRKKEMDVQA